MPRDFDPNKPFTPADFPAAEKPFPIVEVFGYHRELRTDEARSSFRRRHCPFAGNECEKFRQYGYAYCSVTYRTDWDDDYKTYAVCDHRLDAAPVNVAIEDFFGHGRDQRVTVVPEVVLTKPRQSFDFIVMETNGSRFMGIEAQAIDLRGGGVGPANKALLEGDPESWRRRFTTEAKRKGRKDNVAYGVNTANIYKRLGLQIAEKAALMRAWGSRLYVVTQKPPMDYLVRRTNVTWLQEDDPNWEITFVAFDYTGEVARDGQMEFVHKGTFRTTVSRWAEAFVNPTTKLTAEEFLNRVRKKAGLLG